MFRSTKPAGDQETPSHPIQDRSYLNSNQPLVPPATATQLRVLASSIQKDVGEKTPTVMLLGFSTKNNVLLYRPFAELDWNVLPERDVAAAVGYVSKLKFDLIVIDLDNVTLYPPDLIKKIRFRESEDSECKIVALGRYILPEFGNQILRSGADLILPSPQA